MLPDHFDLDDAWKKLEKAVQMREEAAASQTLNRGAVQLSTGEVEQYYITEYTSPKSWRLSEADPIENGVRPTFFRLQGIVTDADLSPPGKAINHQTMERKRPFIRQAIVITGGQLESFNRVVRQIEKAQVMFTAALPAGTVLIAEPRVQDSFTLLDFHTRYFTKANLAPHLPRIPIERTVDPEGNLNAMQADGKYKYTEDNRVEYYGTGIDSQGKPILISPTMIRPGDIVEVTMEFCAYPTSGDKVKCVNVLRAVRIIDSTCRNNAAIGSIRATYQSRVQVPRIPKRRTLYEDGDTENAETQLKRMRM